MRFGGALNNVLDRARPRMSASELAHLLDTWSDALNVAEVVASPFLRVTDRWDLHDWQTIDLPDGMKFERIGPEGLVAEAVVVMNAAERRRRLSGPALGATAVPTWTVLAALD